jgi:hypothetical protein
VCLVSAFLYRRIFVLQEKDLDFFYAHIDDENGSASSVIERRIKSDKRRTLTLLAIAIVIVLWQGIWVPTASYNNEKNQSKLQYEAYLSGYENGWDDQCSAIFSRLGGIENMAFGQSISITYPQCLSLKLASAASDSFAEHIGGYMKDSYTFEINDSGRNHANDDVLAKLFSLSPYWCFGAECVSERDFGIFRP